MAPDLFAVFLEGAEIYIREIETADEERGLILLQCGVSAAGRVEIIELGQRKLPNRWILSVVHDFSGGFNVAGWPMSDPERQRSPERRWYHDDGSRRAFDVAEIRALAAEIEAADPPVMLPVPPPEASKRVRYV